MVDLLWLAAVFLVIGVIAYALGARNLAWFTMDAAKIVFWIFLILFLITVVFRLIS